MKKILGTCLLLLGICCLAGAGFLFFYNEQENIQVERMTEEILPELKNAIQKQKEENHIFRKTADVKTTDQELLNNYLGYLSIPSLDLTLPVLDEWNFDDLKTAPCRYSGSLESGHLVIAAHNYRRHFGLLSSLQPGDSISLTDTTGTVYTYEVRQVSVLKPEAVEEMLSKDWDLTLFTCTYGGQSRVTIRCTSSPRSQE